MRLSVAQPASPSFLCPPGVRGQGYGGHLVTTELPVPAARRTCELLLQTDETADQTKRIIRALADRHYGAADDTDRVLHVHHALQRMLPRRAAVRVPRSDRLRRVRLRPRGGAAGVRATARSRAGEPSLLHCRQRKTGIDGAILADARLPARATAHRPTVRAISGRGLVGLSGDVPGETSVRRVRGQVGRQATQSVQVGGRLAHGTERRRRGRDCRTGTWIEGDEMAHDGKDARQGRRVIAVCSESLP